MISDPSQPGYYRQVCECPLTAHRDPNVTGWPAHDPGPEVRSVDPRPPEALEVPRSVLALQRAAEGAGWAVRVGYARSQERAVRVGTYKVTESWGVYTNLTHGVRLSAVYTRTMGSTTGWSWRNTAIWPIKVPGMGSKFNHALVTDLQEFIRVRGSVLPSWFKGVHAREEDKATKAKLKARQTSKTQKPKEGSS